MYALGITLRTDRGPPKRRTLVRKPTSVIARRYNPGMVLQGEYIPSPRQWVRDQVEAYERSGGREANTLRDTGLPIILVTMRGNKSGQIRKIALMRVEHAGEYALVASMGGAPKNPVWYYNLVAHPDEVTIQDGPEPFAVQVRRVSGDERRVWWQRAVAAYPSYAEYQKKTTREIPVFVATRK
jgi:deazaflavin-dependent oxidoreductase (nitroreductase family)